MTNGEEFYELLSIYMDLNEWNLVQYIYLRKLNLAWLECSDGYYLSPVIL